jgi:hypothetical protein
MQWSGFSIDRVIIHDVPRHSVKSQSPPAPTLSDVDTVLNPEGKLLIREKTLQSVNSKYTLDVRLAPSSSSPVPNLVKEYFDSKDDSYVPISKKLAEHLYASQTGVNPAGLLTVVACSIGSTKGLAIIKLEREEGARLQPQQVNGQQTFGLEVIRDLLLTESTRLFKLGIFMKPDGDDTAICAYACDEQRPYTVRSDVAHFFLRTFLGCEVAEAADVTTAKFLEASQEYFNESVGDSELRVTYTQHLLSELTNQTPTISPRTFAETNLHTEHIQPYLNHVSNKGVVAGQFPKDTKFVDNKLSKLRLNFEHGLSIVGVNIIRCGNW